MSLARVPMAREAPEARARWLPVAAFVTILALAAGIRLYSVDSQGYWYDESCSLQTSSGRGLAHTRVPPGLVVVGAPQLTSLRDAPPWWSVWTSMADDNHPPLYFIVLRSWRATFGEGDRPPRLLSVLCSLLAIALLTDTVRLLNGPRAALWACLLMTVAVPQVHYAQEARGYTMMVALLLGSANAVARIERYGHSARRVVMVGLTALAAVLTHYYAVGPLTAVGIYAAVGFRGRARRGTLLALAAAGAVFLASFGPVLWEQRGRVNANPWFEEEQEAKTWTAARRVLALPIQQLVASYRTFDIPNGWRGGLLIWLGAMTIGVVVVLGNPRDTRFWLLLAIGAVVPAAAFDITRSMGLLARVRFTLAFAPPLFALIAILGARWRGWRFHLPPAVAMCACTLALPAVYEENKPAWREFGALIRSVVPAEGLIAIAYAGDADRLMPSRFVYLHLSHYAYSPLRKVVLLPAVPSPETTARLQAEGVLWVLGGSAEGVGHILPGSRVAPEIIWPELGTLYRVRPRAVRQSVVTDKEHTES